MQGTFTDLSGKKIDFDLDLLKVVSDGHSGIRKGWSATLVYCPVHKKFIELRSSPPSIRGDSLGEASEVDDGYACSNYGLDLTALNELRGG